MTRDQRLFELLDDLEGQAEALYATERDAELADRSRAAYTAVTLASRLMASVGRRVALDVTGAGLLTGTLSRVGTGWCLLSGDVAESLVPCDALTAARGLSARSVPEVAWPAVARLGLGSALRRLADDAAPCVVVTRTGSRHEVVLQRVGADFVEAAAAGDGRRTDVLALAAIGAVQHRADGLG